MKNNLIIYNVVLLLATNALAINISHAHDHNEYDEQQECLECLYHETNSNYILHDYNHAFSSNNYNIFVPESINKIDFYANRIYYSRAPPIS